MYPEGHVTGHLNTGCVVFFSLSLCLEATADMVPKFQVATAFLSHSPPNFNSSKLNPFAVKPTILSKKKSHACCYCT
jgi:hypothetical protein